MWFAAHAYVVFDAVSEEQGKRVLVEESIFLIDAESREAVFDRVDEMKEILVSESGGTIYPGYKYNGVMGIRKVISVLNLDGENISQPADKSEISYELYEFKDREAVKAFLADERIEAKMHAAIKRDDD